MHQKLVFEAERKTKEAELIRAQMQSYMELIIVSLDDDLKQELPFLIEERTGRINRLAKSTEGLWKRFK